MTRECSLRECATSLWKSPVLERDVQRKSVKLAKALDWWAKKFVAQGRRSAPDYIFAKNGRVFWCEFKRTGDDATDLQKEEHRDMREHGLTVYVCDDPEMFRLDILFGEEEIANE